MRITRDGALALIGCVLAALVPLPRHGDALRIGLFSAVIGYIFIDALSRQPDGDRSTSSLGEGRRTTPPPDLSSASEGNRLSGGDLLTDFSILRHLRRTGAISDTEFEAKKVDLLRRV